VTTFGRCWSEDVPVLVLPAEVDWVDCVRSPRWRSPRISGDEVCCCPRDGVAPPRASLRSTTALRAARGGASPSRPGSPRPKRCGDGTEPAGLMTVFDDRTVSLAANRVPRPPGRFPASLRRRKSSVLTRIAPRKFVVPARMTGRTA